MTLDFWKKTGQIRPFATVEEYEEYEKDLIHDVEVQIKANSPLRRATAKKGIANGVQYDSFAEYTFMKYEEKACHSAVERNNKAKFLPYIDEECKQRKWYPDFIVNGVFYEVKGMMRAKDHLKKAQHPEVEWIFQDDCNRMAKELDEKSPGWRDDFIQTSKKY